MFTGLIETLGSVDRLTPRGPGVELTVRADHQLVNELTLGESVAVDGACLTVTHMNRDRFTVDASAETMQRTTLGQRRIGDSLHLERALRLGDRLGGHWVTGHIDGVGALTRRAPLGEAEQLWFSAPPRVMRYLVDKGSIAIDGASLTVNEVGADVFSVVLIPHTQSVLQFHAKSIGSSVNLEADILGKYVERLMMGRSGDSNDLSGDETPHYPSSLNLSTLAKAGFIR